MGAPTLHLACAKHRLYTSSCVTLQELLFLSEAQDQCLKMGPCLEPRSSWNHDSHNYLTEYQLDTRQCVYCLAAWEVWFCHSLVFPEPQLQLQPPHSTPGKLMVEELPVSSLETTISPQDELIQRFSPGDASSSLPGSSLHLHCVLLLSRTN